MKAILCAAAIAAAGACSPAVLAREDPPADSKDLDAARAELEHARTELQHAAAQLARVYAQNGGKSPKAEAMRYWADTNRGFLGVNIEEGPDIDGEMRGVLVTGITPGSGADKAGLKSGDLLLAANGEALAMKATRGASPSHKLMEVMSKTQAGSEVKCDYERAGKKKSVIVVAGRPPAEDAAMWHDDDMGDDDDDDVVMFHSPNAPHAPLPPGLFPGLQLAKLDADLASYFKTGDGVLVVKASDHGSLGLKGGDVIQEIGGERVDSPVDVMDQLTDAKPGSAVMMKVVRQGRTELLKGTAPDHPERMVIHSKRIEMTPPEPPAPPEPPVPPVPPKP